MKKYFLIGSLALSLFAACKGNNNNTAKTDSAKVDTMKIEGETNPVGRTEEEPSRNDTGDVAGPGKGKETGIDTEDKLKH
jgi:hypothetical protein